MAIVLHQDNERSDGSGQQQIHGVECVGNVSFLYDKLITKTKRK